MEKNSSKVSKMYENLGKEKFQKRMEELKVLGIEVSDAEIVWENSGKFNKPEFQYYDNAKLMSFASNNVIIKANEAAIEMGIEPIEVILPEMPVASGKVTTEELYNLNKKRMEIYRRYEESLMLEVKALLVKVSEKYWDEYVKPLYSHKGVIIQQENRTNEMSVHNKNKFYEHYCEIEKGTPGKEHNLQLSHTMGFTYHLIMLNFNGIDESGFEELKKGALKEDVIPNMFLYSGKKPRVTVI